ncbi:ABC transporter permease [Leucobacter sp. Z1108]|uniref:ABC transporter permease n=1 Tax=Leucobacter sp. Z1108 TaxID=3439066 RepID=UPI003F2E9C74
MSTQAGSAVHRPTATRAAWIVAEREITTRLRSKAFLISTGILLLIVLVGALAGGFASKIGGFGGPTKVAVAGEGAAALESAGFEVTEVADSQAARELVESGEVDAAVVPGGAGELGATSSAEGTESTGESAVTVIALESAPSDLVQVLSTSPEVELLDPIIENFFLAYIVSFAFGMVFFVSVMTFGTTTAQSVVEEKQTRIVEILLATVSARALLAGKILGMTVLAVGQVIAIVALASIGLLATGQQILFAELGTALGWFGVLFIFGFVLIATLYAALASLVSRQEDIGSVTSPVMVLVMIPFYLVIFLFDNARMIAVLSYVPLSAPVAMPLRLYLGTAEWWEPMAALAVLLVTFAVVLWIGSRMYSNSVLRTGGRVAWKDALAKTE